MRPLAARPLGPCAFALAMLFAFAAPAAAQDTGDAPEGPAPFVWTDPESGCRYLVAPGAGLTPRLRADGLPDCPDARRWLSEGFERTLREGGEEIGRALQDLGRRLEETR